VKGALFRPDSGPAPHVGVLVMHRTINFLPHLANTELTRRGFLVLGMNSRFDNNDTDIHWEDIALDVKAGVEFLRRQPGITRVVLLGYSGGGPTMSFYQAVAEHGPSYCQGPKKLSSCDNRLAGLPRADAIVFMDASPGAVGVLRGLNPAVTDEGHPDSRFDATLDPFDAANGFVPDRPITYGDAFKTRYYVGQAARMNRLIDQAMARRDAMKNGTGPFPDEDVMVIARAEGARIADPDPSIDHGTRHPQKLLKNNGSVETRLVESILPPVRISEQANRTFQAAKMLTVTSFLSANAIRATDSHEGVDWCSSNTSTPCGVEHIAVPVLVTAMGASTLMRDNEMLFEHAASRDKDFIVAEGLLHGITPCGVCGRPASEYGNGVRNLFDYVAAWINKRL
jgi:pimeloyl-ACP methyl ester carboxylesterase